MRIVKELVEIWLNEVYDTLEQQAEKSNMILIPSSEQERIQEVEKILDS